MTKKLFPNKCERNSQVLDLIHSDVCELNGTLTRGGKRYFITFIDDFSRFTYVYLMRSKYEAFDMFKRFKNKVENLFSKKSKCFIVIEVVNIFQMNLMYFVRNKVWYMSVLRLILRNKMIWQKERTVL